MAEVAARMWAFFSIRESIPEIDEDTEPKLDSEFSRQDQAEHLCLSPRPALDQTRKSSTPLLARRGSPIPHSFLSESPLQTKNMIQNLMDDTVDYIKRTTPVIEFIEYNRELQKAKRKVEGGKFHRRRLSEPVSNLNRLAKDRPRPYRLSIEGMNPTAQAMSHNLVVSTHMGKSPSLRDIFSLKKSSSNTNFTKPGQFLEHLRTHTPSIVEIQRLQHILESRQWSFVQKFVDKGGAMALFSILSGYSRKRQTTPEDINVCTTCCYCIFALLSACEENDELCMKMAHAVKSVVATEMPQVDNLTTCANQIANLTTLCDNSFGHRLVLQEMKLRNDFPLLITLLQTDLSVEGDTRSENLRIKIAVVNMINKLIQSICDTEEQFGLINVFLELKLYPTLMELRRLEHAELIYVINDFEDLILKTYFSLLPRARRLNNQTPKNFNTFHKVDIPAFNITQASMVVPYQPDITTVYEVVAHAYNQASYLLPFDESSYGIFLVERRESAPSSPEPPEVPQSLTTSVSTSFTNSLRESQEIDFMSFSLVSSGEFADTFETEESVVETKAKSPRLDKNHKRRSSSHHHKETIVKNPLFGKVNPVLKRTQSQKLSNYSTRVLTLAAIESEDEDEFIVKQIKNGEWIQSTIKVSSVGYKGWEMKAKPWELTIVCKKRQVVVKVEPETTTFSDVIDKVRFELKKKEQRIFEYNLIMHKTKASENEPSEVWLEPMKYVSSLPPDVRNLELRTRPIPLNIRSKDSTTHAVMVNDTTTIQLVIKEFGNKLGLQGRHLQDYGLYDKITGEWLEFGDILPLLSREKLDLHFLLRPRSISVIYQVADCDLSTLETRRERSSTAYSTLPLYESPSQFHPLNGSLSAYNSPSSSPSYRGFAMEPHSFKCEDLLVHFTLCVSQVQQTVCKELGIDSPEEYSLYKEAPDSAVVELTPWKSLRNQGVIPDSKIYMLRVAGREETTGNDINIWEEPLTDTNLLYEDATKKKVAAGTLNQLVKFLTSETDHDVFFLATFMLTYRSFTDPKTLLRKLGERYTIPPGVDDIVGKTIKAHVGIVLKYWITHEDPAEKDVILDEIAKFVDSIAEDFSDLATRLEKCIQIERDRLNSPRESILAMPEDSNRSPGLHGLMLLELDENTIACQLALQDSERYSKLKIAEFFNQNWLRNKATNLLSMVAHFNSISAAVATSIVSERQIKKRVKIVEKHIVIANCLRKLNDFFSLQAFICAINSSAVNRLKFTMERISTQHAQTLAELEHLMSMENSYKNYRCALREAKPPCVPHIGVYMTDLTFIDEGNSDNYGNLINFSKRSLVSTILIEIESHREVKYHMVGSKKIEQFINHMPRISETELYNASLECEPRGATKSSIR